MARLTRAQERAREQTRVMRAVVPHSEALAAIRSACDDTYRLACERLVDGKADAARLANLRLRVEAIRNTVEAWH